MIDTCGFPKPRILPILLSYFRSVPSAFKCIEIRLLSGTACLADLIILSRICSSFCPRFAFIFEVFHYPIALLLILFTFVPFFCLHFLSCS